MRGKFIVLEGLDGAGKSTQIEMLRHELESAGTATHYLHFPRFDTEVYGEMIASFLRGEMGGVESVDPYFVAMLYAEDRKAAKPMIESWIDDGTVVIVDRYVYSNIGYQCAKLGDSASRERLRQWILDLEYGHFAIPRPDLSLFLDVPFAFTERKLTEQRTGDDRSYLNGGHDIHESSLDLQRAVRQVYLDAAMADSTLRVVDCGRNGSMDTPEGIFGKIMVLVREIL